MFVHANQVLMLARVGTSSGGGVSPWSMLANSSLADALAASDPGTNATGTERYGATLDLNDRHLAVGGCVCLVWLQASRAFGCMSMSICMFAGLHGNLSDMGAMRSDQH